MLTSLIACEQQRDPRWFFPLNPFVQSYWEMIKCVIFGEFFENRKDTLAVTSYLHIFFSTLQNYLKKLHINIMMKCKSGKELKVFGALPSILISTFPFHRIYKVLPNWISFINLVNGDIFSKIVQFCWFIFKRKAMYLSLLSFQRWQSSKLFHINEQLYLLQELVKKTRAMLKHPKSFRG